jgi:hypothetical protein
MFGFVRVLAINVGDISRNLRTSDDVYMIFPLIGIILYTSTSNGDMVEISR